MTLNFGCAQVDLSFYKIEQIDIFVLRGTPHGNFVSYVASYMYYAM